MLFRFGILALAALAIAGPASAATTLGNIYQDNTFLTCENAQGCMPRFQQIPKNKAVVVERLTCTVSLNDSVVPLDAKLVGSKGNLFAIDNLPLLATKQPSTAGFSRYLLTGEGPLIIFGTLKPTVVLEVSSKSVISIDCLLSGTIRKGQNPDL